MLNDQWKMNRHFPCDVHWSFAKSKR